MKLNFFSRSSTYTEASRASRPLLSNTGVLILVGALISVTYVAAGSKAAPLINQAQMDLTAANGQGQAIVYAASTQAHQPYCFDGGNTNGPTHGSGGSGCNGSTSGFDCSGLALYAVYKGTGIVLPHSVAAQATTKGATIVPSQSGLQPGDLVFFGGGSMSRAEHVGIYAGGGMMWDANDFNRPVQERTLSWEEGGAHGLNFDGGMRFRSVSNSSAQAAAPAPTKSAPKPVTISGTPGGTSTSSSGKLQAAEPASNLQSGPQTPNLLGASTSSAATPPKSVPDPSTPAPSQPQPAPTFYETVGSNAHTWTNFSNAGGTGGVVIPSNTTVQIACKLTGFRVADGNTWWYRIASAPWSNQFYVSADAFYNEPGKTTGSLQGTPFVDNSVPGC